MEVGKCNEVLVKEGQMADKIFLIKEGFFLIVKNNLKDVDEGILGFMNS